MTDNRTRILTAIILIFSGIVFLGASLGKYNFSFFFFLKSYWPIFLIIFGFHILLQKSKYWFLVPAATTAVFIYLIYLLFNQEAFRFMPQFRIHFFNFDHLPFWQ